MKMPSAKTLKVFATAALLLSSAGMLVNPSVTTAAPKGTQRIAQSTMTAEMWQNQGSQKRKKGDRKGAIDDYTQAIQLQPTAQRYTLRGIAQHDFGEADQAIADFNQALTMKSNLTANAYILFFRGEAYKMLGDSKLAIADYQKSVELLQKENNQSALKEVLDALKKAQSEIATISNMTAETLVGKVTQYTDGNLAMEYYNRAIKLKSNYAEAYLGRCHSLKDKRNYQSAIADCTQAIKLKPTKVDDYASSYYIRAEAHDGLGKTQATIDDLQQAINLIQKTDNEIAHGLYTERLERCKAGSCDFWNY
jgi:tetratricopeptide (TPR) repeat protein